jgi:hypothetical protein
MAHANCSKALLLGGLLMLAMTAASAQLSASLDPRKQHP